MIQYKDVETEAQKDYKQCGMRIEEGDDTVGKHSEDKLWGI